MNERTMTGERGRNGWDVGDIDGVVDVSVSVFGGREGGNEEEGRSG